MGMWKQFLSQDTKIKNKMFRVLIKKFFSGKIISRITDILLTPIYAVLGYKKPLTSDTYLPVSRNYIGETRLHSLFLLHKYFLKSSGWLESKYRNVSVRNNEYIPWITYSALEFLDSMNLSKTQILEFGSGASTIYFAKRCKKLTSVEEDELYKRSLQSIPLLKNVSILTFQDSDPEIPSTISEIDYEFFLKDVENLEKEGKVYKHDKQFASLIYSQLIELWGQPDIIFIDGGFRNLQLSIASRISKKSLIILDNSDREELSYGIQALRNFGFIEIPFRGLGPLNFYPWTTSVFFLDSAIINRLSSRKLGN